MEKPFKRMNGRRICQVVVIKDDTFKEIFPASRKKCLTDKRTHLQCIVVFGKKIEDRSFNFEGEYDRRHVCLSVYGLDASLR